MSLTWWGSRKFIKFHLFIHFISYLIFFMFLPTILNHTGELLLLNSPVHDKLQC